MADFIALVPVNMLDPDPSTPIGSTSYQWSSNGEFKTNTTPYQGYLHVEKFRQPVGKQIQDLYQYYQESSGRYRLENFKITYPQWIQIYSGDPPYYTDLPLELIEAADNYLSNYSSDGLNILAKKLDQSDVITGSGGGDFLYAFRGDDLLNPGGGDDFVHGGLGFDTVQYSGNYSDYIISSSVNLSEIHSLSDDDSGPYYVAGIDQVFKVSGPDGNDILVDVEKLKFKDGTYNIATGAFTEEDNSSSSGKSKGGKSKKNKRGKGKNNKR